MKTFTELRNDWLKEEKNRRSDIGGKRAKRRYIHFDSRLSHKDLVKSKVWMPNIVIGRSFFPFIRYTLKTRRLKKINGGKEKKIAPKNRDIDFAAHKDALIFSWYAFILTESYEDRIQREGVDKNITAYRKNLGENNVNFAKRVFDFIAKQENCAVLCLDVEHFFPSLDHQLLKNNWMSVLGVDSLPQDHFLIFKQVTQFSYVLMDKLSQALGLKKGHGKTRLCDSQEFRTKVVPLIRVNRKSKGIPQGSPISAVLSNIYMLQFDVAVSRHIEKMKGLYQRYCDDIILVVPTESLKDVERFILNEIEKIKLHINPSKMEKRRFLRVSEKLQSFDHEKNKRLTLKYLGLEFDGERTYIRHNGIGRYQKKMTIAIKKAKDLHRRGKRSAFPKKKIYEKFYHSQVSNFISYAKRAADILGSLQIRRQLSKYRIIKRIKKLRTTTKK